MHILLFTYLLGKHFGPGKQITILAGELRRLGHQVEVLSQTFVPADNQYRLDLQAQGITLHSPGRWADFPWERHKWLRAGLLAPRLLWQLARGLTRGQSWNVTWRQMRALVYQLRMPDGTGGWAARRLNRLHRQAPFDLVHAFSGIGMIFAWVASRHLQVVYNENIVPSLQENWWSDVRRHIHRVAAIIAVCAAAEPAIRAQFGYQGPIFVIAPTLPPPVNTPACAVCDDPRLPLTFGVAARLHPSKGHSYLLQAFQTLRQHALPGGARLLVAGDGGIRPALEEQVQALGLESEVTFLGALKADPMETFWQQIDVFVLPSLWEGLPVTILEAMAHAKPVIATQIDGVAEAVQDQQTGLLVPPADVDALAAALLSLAQDPSRRAALGQAGYERFKACFSTDVIIPQYIAVYRQAIADPRGRHAETA